MKINAITNLSYNNNNHKSCQNNPTFGHIPIGKEFIKELEIQCGKETADNVIAFCNKKINLKEIIQYDNLPLAKKTLADKYFKVMSPDEVEDFTVCFIAKSANHPHYFSYDGSSRLDKDISVHLYTRLPFLEYQPDHDTLKLDTWDPFEFTGFALKSSLWGDTTGKKLEENHKNTMETLKNSIGFTFAGDSWFPVPSEDLYNVIARRINKQLDLLEDSINIGRYRQE